MDLIETARIFYTDNGANITFNLYGPIIGGALLLGRKTKIFKSWKMIIYIVRMILFPVAYLLFTQGPSLLSSMSSAVSSIGGGGGTKNI